jgi:hypothetical protein
MFQQSRENTQAERRISSNGTDLHSEKYCAHYVDFIEQNALHSIDSAIAFSYYIYS